MRNVLFLSLTGISSWHSSLFSTQESCVLQNIVGGMSSEMSREKEDDELMKPAFGGMFE